VRGQAADDPTHPGSRGRTGMQSGAATRSACMPRDDGEERDDDESRRGAKRW
jgi:hypothetical protein